MILTDLVVFLIALLASAYFAAVEIALISANRLKIRQDAKSGILGARLALQLLDDREGVLTTTLVGVSVANLTCAAVATHLITNVRPDWPDWQVSLVTTVLVTFVLLIVGEVIPKVYGKQRSDRFLVAMARPVLATEQLLLPLTVALRAYVTLLLRLLRRSHRRPVVTRDELKILVHDIKSETGLGQKEQKMLRSILGFGETTAREVMVPMADVVSVNQESSTDLLRAMVKRHGFTRIPVYQRRVDRIIGIVNIYDLLFDPEPQDSLSRYIRPALLVPETKRIDRLMVELQRERGTMAVVVSEFGSCVGVVTIEDIVEEIVGELAEEHEVGVRKIRQIAPRTYMIDALTDIDDVNEELRLELPKVRFDTLGGLVLRKFGRIPREHEWFEIQDVRIEVMDTHPFGVRTVKLVLPEPENEREGSS